MTWIEYAILRCARQLMTDEEVTLALRLAAAGDRGNLEAEQRLLAGACRIVIEGEPDAG